MTKLPHPLHAQLKRLGQELDLQIRRKWNRSLPFEESLFDRKERAQALGFGKGSSIYQLSYVYGDVTVGENAWIGPLVILDGTGKLRIGNFCSISAGVQIYSHDTVAWALSGGKAPYAHAPVRIGDACFIGPQATIAKGVTIEDHCAIGAHSFVNRDLPAHSIAVGAPARIVGRVETDAEGGVRLVYDREQTR
ncbi:MAG: acetyltransferase [Candidatus Omnitrophica bacterium CG11_big_fil_rev_8_21_14_0_20_64_10]|nr:MAG: acetyltransferase [Candidatus Omnitrophica bacterium CG11_big_fil_rev_8_21_14_0_20_64_10]